MRKIQLKLDDLAVESFNTAKGQAENSGTVRAHDATTIADGCNFSRGTCFQSCGMTNGYQYCIEPYC
ncbi:hypothetical protein [Longimicrobium sp.]|uniref:hypothetical protein n=1 Tax=Longimicrobium sp. TaxID=2029185 RepID=UPI002E310F75|nr:hypothetical protein [Longimicrobium sp.]HEX6040673.1 hypothetical protein [Longimicrobium sp.]